MPSWKASWTASLRWLQREVAPGTPAYRRSLAKDVVSAAVLGGVGDVVCQLIEKHHLQPVAAGAGTTSISSNKNDEASNQSTASSIDIRRVAALTVFSATYVGGFLHHIYKLYPLFLSSRWLRARVPQNSIFIREGSPTYTLSCATIDNAQCGLLYIPAYFLGVGVLQGDSLSASSTNLEEQWGTAYISCTGFWVPFMWFNFYFVAAEKRVRAMASANLVWSVFIDWLAHSSSSQNDPSSSHERSHERLKNEP